MSASSITASALPLLVYCAAPASPGFWLEKDRTGDGAKFGNVIHLLNEWHLSNKPIDIRAAMVAEGVADSEAARVERVWGNLKEHTDAMRDGANYWRTEMPMALNVNSGDCRSLVIPSKRAYGVELPWVPGTADAIYVGDGEAIVEDVKTGSSRSDSYRWQQRALGVMALRVLAVPKVTVRIVRAGEVECASDWSEVITVDEVPDIVDALREVAIRSRSSKPVAGPHCADFYCRGRKKCSAFQATKT